MAPKSHSAKSACVSKAKSTSSATKIKQELLKGCKLNVSLRKKENIKKMKQGFLTDPKLAAKENGKAELLKDRKSAVPFSAEDNYGAQLKKLKAENDTLRKSLALKDRVTTLTIIPRPAKGTSGRGFNLQEVMGLSDDAETYALLRRSVRDLAAKAGLDCEVPWHRQPKDLISKVIGVARERHNYFKKFPHGWPIEEFLKSSLKNKRSYARKRGYLGDRTNQGVESGEGNEDEGASDEDSYRAAGSNQGGDGDDSESKGGDVDNDEVDQSSCDDKDSEDDMYM